MVNSDFKENGEEMQKILEKKNDKINLRVGDKFIDKVFASAIEKIRPPFMKLLVYICAVAFVAFLIIIAFIQRQYATLLFVVVLIFLALLALFAFIFALQDRRYGYLEKQYRYLANSEEALKAALRELIQDSMLKKEHEKQKEEKE